MRRHSSMFSCAISSALQTIGVLIGTTLPRALRIAEVNIDVGRQREPAICCGRQWRESSD